MVTSGDKFSKNVRNESWLTLLEVNFLKIFRTIMFQQLLTLLRFFLTIPSMIMFILILTNSFTFQV